MTEYSHIRNFCVIAHIDHGKSTLADRLLELTHTVDSRKFRDQMLDDMDLERERGITIKSHPVTMQVKQEGRTLEFNLIDTPGHVDFAYEVSRSMAACEGALLLVDAAQGVEAQTVANTYLAMERNLVIIPVINKIDLPNADIVEAMRQVEEVLAIPAEECIPVSAKTGQGVPELINAIIEKIPPPKSAGKDAPARALVFDSFFDAFRGVVACVRMIDGRIQRGERIRYIASNADTEVKETGIFVPQARATEELEAGDVGYIIGTLKNPADVKIGDTITTVRNPSDQPLPGFREIKPMVFSGLYPVDTNDFEKFRHSLEKLALNDAAFTWHAESCAALGFGFRCGFLGLLHMEIIQERLRREFDMDIISTHPAVIYKVYLRNGDVLELDNPLELPDPTLMDRIEEPMIKASIICHNEHIGDLMKLVMDRRGEVLRTDSMDTRRVMLICSLPLNEILTDFHDLMKSATRGYASMDYELAGYQQSDIVRLDILLNSEPVDAFSSLVHRSRAVARGRQICKALKDEIPPHMFAVPVQAALNKSVIARETIRAFRKDVTAKLYGGDITRKRKVLEKQKEGKKRMKQFGQVHVPQKAFVAVLKGDS